MVCQRLYFTVRTKKRVLLRPGIEPGSSACEALVLTDIRTKLCDDVTDVCAVRNDVLFRCLTYVNGSSGTTVKSETELSTYTIVFSLKHPI